MNNSQKTSKQVLHINKANLSLVKDNEFISIKDNKETISKIHPSKLKSIIINTTITIKSDVLFLAALYKIQITFINQALDSISLYKNQSSSKTLLLQAKLSDEFKLELSKQIILAKCKNQCNFIKRMDKYHKTYKNNISNMKEYISKIKQAKNTQELLTIEGKVALWYFDVFTKRFNDYGFIKRHKKGAKDIINMSLNYLYAILYNKIQKLMIDININPYLGLFHSNNDKNTSLVYDFIEEFRVYVVDMIVFAWFSHRPNASNELNSELKAKLGKMFAKRLLDTLYYEGKNLSIDEIIQKQLKKLKIAITTNTKYKGFCPNIC